MFDFETQVLLLTVERLNRTQLYTGAEAAATRYDPVRQRHQYRRLGKRVWNLTKRGSDPIWDWPDNCETNQNGYPLIEHTHARTRRKLLDGHDLPRWQGNTIQSTLNADEQHFLIINRLINTLSDRACYLIDAEEDQAPRAQEAAKIPEEEVREEVLEVVPVVLSEIPTIPISRRTPLLTSRRLMLAAIAALCLWFSQPIQNRSQVPESYRLAVDDYLKRTQSPPVFGHSPPVVFSQLSESWKETQEGKTPFQFGVDLLSSGHPEKAKEWFVAAGIETKDLQFIYGLAFVKWFSGDSQGAAEDSGYILSKNPTPIVLARTHYLLGAIGVDNQDFELARQNLLKALNGYRELGKNGGLYLCYSMMALNAVYQKNFDAVEPLLEKAREHNLLIAKPYGEGRYYEILSEMHFLKGNYTEALLTAQESQDQYTQANQLHLADEVQARVGLLLLLNGRPQAAYAVSSKLWEKFHTSSDRSRLLAYNAITLMKLSLCAGNTDDAQDKERAALAWAKSTATNNSLVRTLNWVKDEKNVPCPAWR